MNSTVSLYQTLVSQLTSSTTFAAAVPNCYAVRPPRKVDYPYAILSLTGAADSDYEGKEYRGTMELQLIGYPRSAGAALERAADAADIAFDSFTTVTAAGPSKVRVLRRTSRDAIPAWPDGAGADPDVVQTRQTWAIEVGPGWITR